MDTIIQTSLKIPAEIQRGISAGELVKNGSVVRNLAGQFVTYLDEVASVDGAKGVSGQVAQALKNPKSVVGMAVVAVAGTAALGAAAYRGAQRKKLAQLDPPKCVENFSASLTAYLEAARNGELNAGIINRLIADMDAVKAEADSAVNLQLSSAGLVELVADHTRTLVEANQLEPGKLPGPPHDEDADIVGLRPYLEVQRDLFS